MTLAKAEGSAKGFGVTVAQQSPKLFVEVQIFQSLPAERRNKSKGGNMTQNELNFLQEALYIKCDTLLKTIADNNNSQVKKEKKEKTNNG